LSVFGTHPCLDFALDRRRVLKHLARLLAERAQAIPLLLILILLLEVEFIRHHLHETILLLVEGSLHVV